MNMDPVKSLLEFISIRTDHPEPHYDEAIEFIKQLSESMQFSTEIIELVNNKKAILVYYDSSQDHDKPWILLNCHIDVVKVDDNLWTRDCWGEMVDDKIYGRGTQDMKSLGIMYLYALYRLKNEGFVPKKPIVISFVPDEEIMGTDGMNVLVDKLPKIDFALDEGIPSESNELTLYYGERKTWWVKLESQGEAGHGSKYVNKNATVNIIETLDELLKYAKSQKKRLGTEKISEVVTMNFNYLNTGNSKFYNVIPSNCEAGLDIRIPPSVNLEEFETMIKSICNKNQIKYFFINGTEKNHLINNITDLNNKYVKDMKNELEKNDIKINLEIFPASTDARYLRTAGINCLGFSPIRHTPVLLHDHDEYIPTKSLYEGIDLYYFIIRIFNE